VSVTAVTTLRAKHHDAGRGKAHANFEENILLDVISQQQNISRFSVFMKLSQLALS
jgi:hypothetical protein